MEAKFIEKARKELGEDDLRKSQLLEQFREFISKHQFLSNAPKDEIFLTFFLRARKYRINEVFQSFDRFFLIKKRFPDFDLKIEHAKLSQRMITEEVFMPLKKRSKKGQKIILQHFDKVNMNISTPMDLTNALFFSYFVSQFDEETQVNGMIFVVDYGAATTKHACSPAALLEGHKYFKYTKFIRYPQVFVINMTPVMNFCCDFFMSVASEKMKKRVHFLKDKEELRNFIDPDLLPRSFGGNCELEDVVEDFDSFYGKHEKKIETIFAAEVDWSKVPEKAIWNDEDEGEYVGSFRRLEID